MSREEKITRMAEKMKSEMMVDCMLDEMLYDLHDVKKTNHAVQAFANMMSTVPAISGISFSFLSRVVNGSSCLSRCSTFQKRLLLFLVMESVIVGEDISVKYTSDNLAPLETTLLRLSYVVYAFENEIVPEDFTPVWIQTVKQAIIMFLKNNQSVSASKILLLYREHISKPQDHYGMLKNFIEVCTNDNSFLPKWLNQEGHEYSSYYHAMADFIQALNSLLDETSLVNIAQKMNMSLTHEDSDDADIESYGDSDVPENDSNTDIDAPTESRQKQTSFVGKINSTDNVEKACEPQVSDADSSFKNNESVKPKENQQQTKIQSDDDDNDGDDADDNDDDDCIPKTSNTMESSKVNERLLNTSTNLSPKNSLTYRLKKRTYSTGIIIPCKHIVNHCRKVNSELNEDNEKKKKTSVNRHQKPPIILSTANLARSSYKPIISPAPRNLLLGERFEDLNSTTTSTIRSYSSKTKMVFNIELDSFLVAGCKHFGVGHWVKILAAFPFPSICTNVKLKDRFRNLIKLQFIALLDDGDFVVINNDLKARLESARKKINKVQKENKPQTVHHDSSDCQTKSDDNKYGRSKENKRKNKESKYPQKRNKAHEVDVVSMSSETEEKQRVPPQHVAITFSSLEDAYLLCGARHLGSRWDSLRDYFDFSQNITTSDIQRRWETLIQTGKISVDDNEIICNDNNLQKKSEEVTSDLKRRIQDQRKQFAESTTGDAGSESEDDSDVEQNKSLRRRRYMVGNSSSEEEPKQVKQSSEYNQQAGVTSKPLSTLNTSMETGTQTIRSKFTLRRNSPSILEASSSSSMSDASDHDNRKPFQVGSPIRPSMINIFKRPQEQLQPGNEPGKRRKRERSNSLVKNMRERRIREIMRMQRKKPVIHRNPWKDAEIEELLKGLSKHGPGKWSNILDDGWEVFNCRTSVMLKDKFRNMLKSDSIPEDLKLLWEAKKASRRNRMEEQD